MKLPVPALLFLLPAFGTLLLLGGQGVYPGLPLASIGGVLWIVFAIVALDRCPTPKPGLGGQHLSPAEWRAWIGLGVCAIALAYFLVNLPLIRHETWPHAAHARAVGGNLVMLLVAWAVGGRVMASRWRDRVQEDERDRAIASRAERSGATGLALAVICLVVTLGLSPPARLQWASHFLIAHLLLAALLWGWLVEHATQAWLHWQDRR